LASQSWTPDALGNFTSVTTNGSTQTRSANQQNEITSISDQNNPTYDANGNLTSDGTGNSYVYDAWNELVAVKSNGTTVASYSYDGLGRRITQTEGGTTSDLYYSAADQVLEEAVGGAAQARNVWSPVYVNALVLRDQSSQQNGLLDQRLYVQQDANWNVTALVDASGNVLEHYQYDPYGAVTVLSANWSVQGSSSYKVPYGFQGMGYDWTVNVNFADNRVYSPTLMRWLQTDPIGLNAGNNDYAMESNGPTEAVDPSGLAPNAFDRWMAQLTGAATPWAYVSPIIQHPEAITVSNLASGANYGSAVMLNEMTFGNMPGAEGYIDKHKDEYSPELTGVVQGLGAVSRESLIAAGTAGMGNIVQGGRAAGYSARTIQAARAAQAAATVREGYQTYQGAKATVQAYQKGDTAGVLLNGAGTLLSGTGTYCGTRSLLKTPARGATVMTCFPTDTLVGTERGLRPIAQVEAGDRVWAYDFLNGVWRLCLVECRHDANYDGPLVTLHADEGKVTATAYHPVWVIQGDDLASRPIPRHLDPDEDQGGSLPGRWVNSHDLREGDVVFLRGRGPVTVRRIVQRHEQTPVCNLTVRDLHTFAVGLNQFLVHNVSGTGGAPQGISRVGQARPGVTEVALADLNPLHPVPRPGMPPNHINDLANSIRANGYDMSQAVPVARMPDGRLVQLGGHHRAAAMGQLGETTIPARVVDWNSLNPRVQQWWQQQFPNFPWSDFIP
jgi:RHS repeat-associated protein